MNLYEYETKKLLRDHGIPTPKGEVTSSPRHARMLAAELKPPFAIKAQVLVAGRGKAGGILFANSPGDVEKAAKKLFKIQVKGVAVQKILIEEKIHLKKELYLGVTIDRAKRKYVLITSGRGGVDIESIAEKTPEKIVKTLLDSRTNFEFSEAKEIAEKIGYNGTRQTVLADIIYQFVCVGMAYDAELIEINPLAETEDGGFVALDARLIMDDNALFRHKEYQEKLFSEGRERGLAEIEAMKKGLTYVKLEGNIGVVGNGAGLVMATIDVIQFFGGRPADFMDLGGGAPIERIAVALKLLLSDKDVKVLFINILGGITHCDDVARGIVQAKASMNSKLPFVVRLVGTNEEEGKRILNEAGFQVLDSMEEAAQLSVKLAEA